MHPEQQYLDLLVEILNQPPRPDRTGTGTRSVFGRRMEFHMRDGFPLFTTKRLPFKTIAHELLWMISGSSNVKDLQARGVRIWDEWADQDGDLGPVYGNQWRSCPDHMGGEIDQLGDALEGLKTNPYSRRHVISAWNVAQIDDMALPPCHMMFQYYVEHDDSLSLQLYQRSADAFLGLPFNIASYALLLRMTAHMLGRRAGRLIWIGGDVHLYQNHLDQAWRQVERIPFELPALMCGTWVDQHQMVPGEKTWEDWSISKLDVMQYISHSHIAGDVSV